MEMEMEPLLLEMDGLHMIPEGELRKLLESAKGRGQDILVRVATPSIEQAWSYANMAEDYLSALVLGELMASSCSRGDCWHFEGTKGRISHIEFRLGVAHAPGLARALAWYSQSVALMAGSEPDEWVPEYPDWGEFEEFRATFADDMEGRVKMFDTLAKSYVRCLTAGLSESYDGPELQDMYRQGRELFGKWWDQSLESPSNPE